MISNSELKYIQSFAHKKHWTQESVFIIEGPKLLEEAIKANCVIEKIYATKAWEGKLGQSAGDIEEIDEIMLSRISQLQTPNQVVALVQKNKEAAPFSYQNKLSLVLDGIQDPGNLGTIIRTADWFGIDQIVVSEDTAGWYNPKVIQSTMGSCFRVNLRSMDLETILQANAKSKNKLPVYGALLNGKSMHEIKWEPSNFILIGNESKGIRENLMPFISHPISIPRTGEAESLNAAVATGIILANAKA
jgi:TrmH family RNA methyltransferase